MLLIVTDPIPAARNNFLCILMVSTFQFKLFLDANKALLYQRVAYVISHIGHL